jgi:2-dehydropantoate 2-reductase
MKITSERIDNNIRFDGPSTMGLIYGEADTDTYKDGSSKRVLAIAELLDGTGLNYRICGDIIRQIWFKFGLNVSNNQPQAILSCGYGAYEDSAHAAFIRDRLLEEVVAVAKAKGIDLSTPDETAVSRSKAAKRARFSTLQDLDAHRHTEVDMFAKAVVRMGKELGVPTPYNEMTYHIIKALEEKNDGLFDYD